MLFNGLKAMESIIARIPLDDRDRCTGLLSQLALRAGSLDRQEPGNARETVHVIMVVGAMAAMFHTSPSFILSSELLQSRLP